MRNEYPPPFSVAVADPDPEPVPVPIKECSERACRSWCTPWPFGLSRAASSASAGGIGSSIVGGGPFIGGMHRDVRLPAPLPLLSLEDAVEAGITAGAGVFEIVCAAFSSTLAL